MYKHVGTFLNLNLTRKWHNVQLKQNIHG